MDQPISKRVQELPVSSIRLVFEKARKIKDVVRLELGEPDFDTPDHIKKAAKIALNKGFTHYTPFAGTEELRGAIARKCRTDNAIDADTKEVVVTPGACSAIFCSLLSVINAGDQVLVPDPAWPHYDACVKVVDGVTAHYPLYEKNGFQIDIEDLKKRVNVRTRAIIINSPSNPTGAVQTRKHLEDIAELAVERDLLVISDEVYEKMVYENAQQMSIASLPEMKERTITINSFSKTYAMTGWRVGYAVAKEDIAIQMAKLVLYTSTCANSIAQEAALAALKGPQGCVEKMAAEYKRRRDFLVKHLNQIEGISCLKPQGSFYVFPNIEKLGMSSLACAMWLLDKARTSTVPGSGFGPNGEGHIRISCAASLENLEKAIRRITNAIKSR